LRNERQDHTIEPTELVDEVYVRLLDQEKAPFCLDCSHFFAIAARLMREILVDNARRRQAGKRAGHRVSLIAAMSVPDARSANLLTLDDDLKALEELDARKGKAIELRYFAGFSTKEIAEALNVSAKNGSARSDASRSLALSPNAERSAP
jgi:RNA polymerase sigma factor (TIGR02999 family)